MSDKIPVAEGLRLAKGCAGTLWSSRSFKSDGYKSHDYLAHAANNYPDALRWARDAQPYMQHRDDCGAVYPSTINPDPCDCGLDELFDRIEDKGEGT